MQNPSLHFITLTSIRAGDQSGKCAFYHFYWAVVDAFVVTYAAVPYWPDGLSFNALKWRKKKGLWVQRLTAAKEGCSPSPAWKQAHQSNPPQSVSENLLAVLQRLTGSNLH